MNGTRVGLIPNPEREGRANQITCYRCGLQWVDSASKYQPHAPCPDCRYFLTRELHVLNSYWKRPGLGLLSPCEREEQENNRHRTRLIERLERRAG